MDLTLEALIVAVFAVLPGFVSSAVRTAIVPGENASAGEWVAGSVVGSLALNALALAGFILLADVIELTDEVAVIADEVRKLSGWTVVYYLTTVYGLALFWGVMSALASDYAPRAIAHRLRLTPVSPSPNVFNDCIKKLVATPANRKLRGTPNQLLPWLRLQRQTTVIVGSLKNGSVDFAVDHPIEIFLSPAVILEGGTAVNWTHDSAIREYLRGVYLRVLPDDILEVFAAPKGWNPLTPLPAGISETVGGSTH